MLLKYSALALIALSAVSADRYIASVDVGTKLGAPRHLASGILYGIPDVQNQIPDHWYTDIGFKYNRAGGAQISAKGWRLGYAQYVPRFQSALSNYQTTRKYGGRFVLLIHDMWGADGTQGSGGIWPCDNGDCTEWDNFLRQVVTDLKANNMIEGLEIDLWNEPDGGGFWAKSRSQYLQTYNWAYHRLRELLPGTLFVGPSAAQQPTTGNTFWTDWMSNVVANGSIPDKYSWHLLGGQGGFSGGPQDDAGFSISQLTALRNTYGAPVRPYQVNEYGPSNFQNPNNVGWFVSNFERYDVQGLRANWGSNLGSGQDLHDGLALLINRNSTTAAYTALAEYWVYNYYTLFQTGQRVATTPGDLLWFNLYATVDSVNKRIGVITSTAGQTGTFTTQFNNLNTESSWLIKNNQVRVQIKEYRKYAQLMESDGPVTISDTLVTVTNGALSVPYTLTNGGWIWTISLLPPA